MLATIVIPNYNGYRFLKDCLDSIQNQKYKNFKTIVIDNASTDESCDFIRKNYPWIDLQILDKNYGFCGGVNKGIELTETPYVILLNNDTQIDENFVEELVNSIQKNKDSFSCSSKMISFHERNKMDDAGDLLNVFGWAFQRGNDRKIELYNKDKVIFSSCAGAAIYKKEVFEKIGYFDENHFAYLEDVDIGYRALLYGYKNYYCSKAIVYHVGSGTTGSKYNEFKVRHSSRNNIYLIYKNMPLIQVIINFLPLLIGFSVKYFFFKKKGYSTEYVAGISEGFKNRKNLRKVPFSYNRILNYLRIEYYLIKNAFIYLFDKFSR